MHGKGINYDTGTFPGGRSSRETFDPAVVRRELRIIADDLHCNAVRVTGGDPGRLSVAGEAAAEAGLQVWFSPFPTELNPEELLELFDDCAGQAESLRRDGADVVLIAGCELSMFASGFIPGEDAYARMATMSSGDPELWASLTEVPAKMNAFFADAAATVRKRFGGPVTYAAGPGRRSTGARSTSSASTPTAPPTTRRTTARSCGATSSTASRWWSPSSAAAPTVAPPTPAPPAG